MVASDAFDLATLAERQVEEAGIALDPAQQRAFVHATSSRVANIVGPPGTGKSFAGGEIARAVLGATDETLLVVCFTNHALDQFLNHLLDSGENRIVRIGGRSRDANLERFSLFNLKREVKLGHDRDERKRVWSLKQDLEDARLRMTEAFERLVVSSMSWHEIQEFLAIEDPDALDQLTLPEDADGFQGVVGRGKTAGEDYLWKRWQEGRTCHPYAEAGLVPPGVDSLWRLSKEQRQAKLAQWIELSLEEVRENLITARHEYDLLDAELCAMDTASERLVLRNARVIGATTTGSAKYRTLIESASPGVLLLEEAGEVLEAHVISSLSASIKHVIMIGDHKQLRPKVETHALTIAARGGYDLNRSLFERMILGGLPHEVLQMQHRMRPEISLIARQMTYPELLDHGNVNGRPDVRGLASNVIFIKHTRLEQGAIDDGSVFKSLSKINEFEADMAVQVVQFLLLQGYRSDQMVVLTPYLGQLKVLNDKFRRYQIAAAVGDRDADDLLNIGVDQPWLHQAGQSAHGVRTCTIDNYQGEEADLIITTLVRSNQKGQLGFLGKADAEQRVNVLCTRARFGMIFIGNSDCFLNATPRSPLWVRLLGIFQERGWMFDALPIKCEQHEALCEPVDVNTPESLRFWCARGAGCGRQCDALLRCGHVCPLRCHPATWDHDKILCQQPIREDCPAGLHRIERACSSRARPYCEHKIVEQCPSGHPLVRDCGAVIAPSCKVCDVLREAETVSGKAEADRAKKETELLHQYAQRLAETAVQDADGATEAMHRDAEVAMAHLTRTLATEQQEVHLKLAERLDAATHEAEQAVRAALQDVEARKRRDEARLQARRGEHERMLRATAEQMEQQRAAAQAAAEAQVQDCDDKMRALHDAHVANLAADEAAIAQVNAERADPAEVARQLEHVRQSAKAVTCHVCMDDLTILDGPLCRSVDGHFLCNGCFDRHIKEEAAKPGFDGNIFCPCRPATAGGCMSAPYADYVIARYATQDGFDAVSRSRAALQEKQNNEIMQREFDARLEQERAKFQQLLAAQEAGELKLREAKTHIVQKILTLSCPRCGQAFIDFNGCFALVCSRQGCSCGFCAYCLKDCGSDAHAHVATCTSNGGRDVFATAGDFDHVQHTRRERMVHEYLRRFNPDERRKLCQMCKQEFADLRLDIRPN